MVTDTKVYCSERTTRSGLEHGPSRFESGIKTVILQPTNTGARNNCRQVFLEKHVGRKKNTIRDFFSTTNSFVPAAFITFLFPKGAVGRYCRISICGIVVPAIGLGSLKNHYKNPFYLLTRKSRLSSIRRLWICLKRYYLPAVSTSISRVICFICIYFIRIAVNMIYVDNLKTII